jgi:hypothetical protein
LSTLARLADNIAINVDNAMKKAKQCLAWDYALTGQKMLEICPKSGVSACPEFFL